jgi:two-component sensor histidine kinase
MSLALYFLYNNNKVNQLLLQTNKQLVFQQELLKKENTTRKIAEEQALSSLNHREILLSEIHHRVKNNLAIVTALIELQTFYIEDHKTVQILKESQHRIKSIALLHEKLYENKSLKTVDISSYTNELINFIKYSLSNKNKTITIHCDVEKINLEMERAMPFGLLLNELITNSYKHAFNNKETGNIWLSLNEEGNRYILKYEDDGPGFETNNHTKTKTLGLNLIESFCMQLNGNFSYKTINDKIVFEFEFPTLKQ